MLVDSHALTNENQLAMSIRMDFLDLSRILHFKPTSADF